jgi:hypothetical protein
MVRIPGQAPDQVITSQLNTTLGLTFNGPDKFAHLPLWPLRAASAGIGLIAGFVSIRLRRLELAGALHAGWAKTPLALQTLAETLIWLLLALAPALVASLWAAQYHNPGDWTSAYDPATRTLGLTALTTLIGALAAIALTKEHHLFHYFKQR